ncbi:MAG TPA: class I SAM-dependent methyltransferase [Clostridiales bacterium]|nr:class I SAM-dependent methyltransferase [Clostridiales bacterium]
MIKINSFLLDSSADKYDNSLAKDIIRNELLLPEILTMLNKVEDLNILEAGCGTGYILKHLIKLNPKRLVAFDNLEQMVTKAKSIYQAENIQIQILDLEDYLPWRNEFDVVLGIMLLHLCKNIEKALDNINKVLKPHGRLIIVIPHPCYHFDTSFLDQIKNSGLNKLPNDRYANENIVHNQIGNPPINIKMYHRPTEFYINMLIKCGFKIKGIKEPVFNKSSSIWYFIPPFLFIDAEKGD